MRKITIPLERRGAVFLLAAVLCVAAGCAGKPSPRVDSHPPWQKGVASYIGHKFHGRPTASAEIYDENDFTAAHRSYPFGTRVRVVNLENGRSTVVRINDRGPFVRGRIIDVSIRAAKELGFVRQGLTRVRVEVIP